MSTWVLQTPFGKCRTQVNLNFYDHGQASGPACTIEQHSIWQGKMSLHGRDWQVGMVQNAQAAAGALSNGQLLLRPWENRNQPFSVTDQIAGQCSPGAESFFGRARVSKRIVERPGGKRRSQAVPDSRNKPTRAGGFEDHRAIHRTACFDGRALPGGAG